jgi:hypothetical protein
MARKKTAIAQVGLRLREPLRAKIVKAANARGVSMNQELVDRIEGSILSQDDVFGDARMYRFARFVALGIQLVERATKKSWETDFETKQTVKAAVGRLFDTFGPEKPERGGSVLEISDRAHHVGTKAMDEMVRSVRKTVAESREK